MSASMSVAIMGVVAVVLVEEGAAEEGRVLSEYMLPKKSCGSSWLCRHCC